MASSRTRYYCPDTISSKCNAFFCNEEKAEVKCVICRKNFIDSEITEYKFPKFDAASTGQTGHMFNVKDIIQTAQHQYAHRSCFFDSKQNVNGKYKKYEPLNEKQYEFPKVSYKGFVPGSRVRDEQTRLVDWDSPIMNHRFDQDPKFNTKNYQDNIRKKGLDYLVERGFFTNNEYADYSKQMEKDLKAKIKSDNYYQQQIDMTGALLDSGALEDHEQPDKNPSPPSAKITRMNDLTQQEEHIEFEYVNELYDRVLQRYDDGNLNCTWDALPIYQNYKRNDADGKLKELQELRLNGYQQIYNTKREYEDKEHNKIEIYPYTEEPNKPYTISSIFRNEHYSYALPENFKWLDSQSITMVIKLNGKSVGLVDYMVADKPKTAKGHMSLPFDAKRILYLNNVAVDASVQGLSKYAMWYAMNLAIFINKYCDIENRNLLHDKKQGKKFPRIELIYLVTSDNNSGVNITAESLGWIPSYDKGVWYSNYWCWNVPEFAIAPEKAEVPLCIVSSQFGDIVESKLPAGSFYDFQIEKLSYGTSETATKNKSVDVLFNKYTKGFETQKKNMEIAIAERKLELDAPAKQIVIKNHTGKSKKSKLDYEEYLVKTKNAQEKLDKHKREEVDPNPLFEKFVAELPKSISELTKSGAAGGGAAVSSTGGSPGPAMTGPIAAANAGAAGGGAAVSSTGGSPGPAMTGPIAAANAGATGGGAAGGSPGPAMTGPTAAANAGAAGGGAAGGSPGPAMTGPNAAEKAAAAEKEKEKREKEQEERERLKKEKESLDFFELHKNLLQHEYYLKNYSETNKSPKEMISTDMTYEEMVDFIKRKEALDESPGKMLKYEDYIRGYSEQITIEELQKHTTLFLKEKYSFILEFENNTAKKYEGRFTPEELKCGDRDKTQIFLDVCKKVGNRFDVVNRFDKKYECNVYFDDMVNLVGFDEDTIEQIGPYYEELSRNPIRSKIEEIAKNVRALVLRSTEFETNIADAEKTKKMTFAEKKIFVDDLVLKKNNKKSQKEKDEQKKKENNFLSENKEALAHEKSLNGKTLNYEDSLVFINELKRKVQIPAKEKECLEYVQPYPKQIEEWEKGKKTTQSLSEKKIYIVQFEKETISPYEPELDSIKPKSNLQTKALFVLKTLQDIGTELGKIKKYEADFKLKMGIGEMEEFIKMSDDDQKLIGPYFVELRDTGSTTIRTPLSERLSTVEKAEEDFRPYHTEIGAENKNKGVNMTLGETQKFVDKLKAASSTTTKGKAAKGKALKKGANKPPATKLPATKTPATKTPATKTPATKTPTTPLSRKAIEAYVKDITEKCEIYEIRQGIINLAASDKLTAEYAKEIEGKILVNYDARPEFCIY